MNYTRRTVLKNSAIMSGGLIALRSANAQPRRTASVEVSTIQDPKIKEIISRAIDTAIAAGASYADARMSHAYSMVSGRVRVPSLTEDMSIGVRALYQGYWGFASSPVWSLDEGARLGAAALRQAKINVFGTPREIELAPVADLASGHWTMPVKDDPFRTDFDEIADYRTGLDFYIRSTFPNTKIVSVRIKFDKTEKAFGSSLGQFTTQTLYSTSGNVGFTVGAPQPGVTGSIGIALDTLTPAGMGFEYMRDQDIREQCRIAYQEALEIMQLPSEPVDVGKYSVLLQPQGTAHLLSRSIGQATQVDRAMGYEANAGGTSYIVDPVTMVGSFKMGSPLVNVSGNRSSPGSVGMVKWDDEGVSPKKFDIVKDGILANMQVNREGAGWMKDHYTKTNQPFQSYGCGFSATSLDVPLIYNADLTLESPSSAATLDSMRSNLENGLEIMNAEFSMDFQQMTGLGRGEYIFKIKNGKRVSKLVGAGSIFRTSELWGNVIELGGAASARRFGVTEEKGEPLQEGTHSVTAPPMLVKELTIVDLKKKA